MVSVSGPDRLSWLHSITTQHVEALGVGASTTALVLSPHGHVEHELHLVDDGDTTWIVTEPASAPALLGYLESMRFMLRVEVADRTSELAVVGEHSARPDVDAVTAVSWVSPPQYGELAADEASAGYVPRRPAAWRVREVLVPRAELSGYLDGAGSPAGTWAWEALRVAAGVPRLAHETDHRTIPHEVGLGHRRGPPAEGLLSRPGDGGARPQPRSPAASPGAAAPRRQRQPVPVDR